ncbi:MAG: DUF1028 domain-containing protein [Alphaproteobacteria bacterium]
MTFTIVAASPETGEFGVGIATYSLGVGGYCPFFARGKGAISTQAFANPRLGPIAVDALGAGSTVDGALEMLAGADPDFDYRQVCIVGANGQVAMHTGPSTRAWAGHRVGESYAVFGNVLAGAATVDAMQAAYESGGALPFAERLLAAIEAGRDGGGQADASGARLPERSAALIVRGEDIAHDIDLRVDVHGDAVTELRRVYARYLPYRDYYALRADDPANTPAQDVFARDHNLPPD